MKFSIRTLEACCIKHRTPVSKSKGPRKRRGCSRDALQGTPSSSVKRRPVSRILTLHVQTLKERCRTKVQARGPGERSLGTEGSESAGSETHRMRYTAVACFCLPRHNGKRRVPGTSEGQTTPV